MYFNSEAEALNELIDYFEKQIKTKEKENKYLQELVTFYSKLQLT